MDLTITTSPNIKIEPITAETNQAGHLVIGGCDTVELAERFGTPLWIVDEQTVRQAAKACLQGLGDYPNARVLYAGKAFLCMAMCKLVQSAGLGLDVVSEGELYTATKAGFPAHLIYMHGNNKSQAEIDAAISQQINIVIDNHSEALMIAGRAATLALKANVLLRVTPGVEPDTHKHIKTGQHDSKFGVPLTDVGSLASFISDHKEFLNFLGLHAHIGSQSLDLSPYLQIVEILADLIVELRDQYSLEVKQLDLGGGLGITYTQGQQALPIYEWSQSISERVKEVFTKRSLPLPQLLLEPGRAIIGTAGVTLYRAGHAKTMANNTRYLAVDGGMADNPRPITYEAEYTAVLANRMDAAPSGNPLILAGRYCESGDIIIKEAYLDAEPGDLIAIFGTGAYNYSMASNYNRTPRPACVLVSGGTPDLIIERETNDDLIRQDHIPSRLMEKPQD